MSRRNQILLGILGVVLLVGAVINVNSNKAKENYNTNRNTFLSGCTEVIEKAGYSSQQANKECECATTVMEKRYPNFLTNTTLQAEMIKNGFSKEDTDSIAICKT